MQDERGNKMSGYWSGPNIIVISCWSIDQYRLFDDPNDAEVSGRVQWSLPRAAPEHW